MSSSLDFPISQLLYFSTSLSLNLSMCSFSEVHRYLPCPSRWVVAHTAKRLVSAIRLIDPSKAFILIILSASRTNTLSELFLQYVSTAIYSIDPYVSDQIVLETAVLPQQTRRRL